MKKLARRECELLAEAYPGVMAINNHFLAATSIPLFLPGHSGHSRSGFVSLSLINPYYQGLSPQQLEFLLN